MPAGEPADYIARIAGGIFNTETGQICYPPYNYPNPNSYRDRTISLDECDYDIVATEYCPKCGAKVLK